LDAVDFAGKPRPEIYVRPKENLDLEDMGFLIQLAHKARRHGAKLCLKSPNLKVQKILREIHLDAVLDVQHASGAVRNFLTVDVECWFHAYNMRAVAPKCTWHLQPSRIVQNMEMLLELMRANHTKATFFILGWVADHYPEVVRMIDQEGHEIGTHGYHHDLLTEMTPAEFEHDLVKSLEAIGRHTSQPIRGHRASNFTLVKSTLWALEILAKHGIEYDSSIFPIARKRYGIPDYPNRLPHTLQLESGTTLKEIPMSTMKMGGKLYPIGGGGYLRLYPLGLTEKFIEQANLRGLPAMVYLHPWEVDLQQDKRYLGGAMKTFQHYVNMDTTEWKLNRLLQRFDFSSVAENFQLPRIERLFRRSPVQVLGLHSDQYTAARSSAYARALESKPGGAHEAVLEAELAERRAG
jgi:polysaccharide deacetylase family protein (PEP-CTERM system associated)